jgi:hypothetical protein
VKVVFFAAIVPMLLFGLVVTFLALRALMRHSRDAGLKVQPWLGQSPNLDDDESSRPTPGE